ncbi:MULTISPECIES: iron ABC transporter permease [unclassified Paenibacillus]|uniref:FecCD family ABC transporter permease n=1 Tax=unclassified Paenibacillus TaxID=185978 RepID=UPI001AE75804|nr:MULTISPECIES: iron ABC transporter permease [unclassified Paenibacillus]MBP1153879.1 iron complex transport system permease protein [Paenibacillus sp. PvP091]MBP1170736.1 iron complex transport system permease protein [Paenibacillus sp. PvR098]MBP2441764.1 iron complex transport system permease protein [Paenibacillus sp. PvP052]
MRTRLHSNLSFKIGGLIAALLLLAAFMLASVMFGVNHYSLSSIIAAYTQHDGSNEHIIIQTARVPRALIAAVVGGSLAVAGALMQAITRNPLASPSIFGVNAGAAFAIVLAVSIFDVSGLRQFTWIAFLGAAVSSGAVYFLGSIGRDGLTPIKITLAGSAITAFFASLTQGILLADGKAFDQVLFWLVGSVAGRTMEMLLSVLPYMLIAMVGALLLSPHINVLSMGDDVAKGLGQRTILIKAAAAVVIVLLAGGSVAVAGPVVFVGIIIPHIARYLVGIDYRWVLPYCAVLGALLLVGADIGARFVAMPKEVHVGVTTALIGVPFFVYIARKGGQLK